MLTPEVNLVGIRSVRNQRKEYYVLCAAAYSHTQSYWSPLKLMIFEQQALSDEELMRGLLEAALYGSMTGEHKCSVIIFLLEYRFLLALP